MKKVTIILSVMFIPLLAAFLLYFFYNIEVKSIKQLNFNNETDKLTIEITKKNNIFNKEFSCSLLSDDNKITEEGKDNKCILTFKIGKDYTLVLEDKYKKSDDYNILDYINNTLEFKFTHETMYLVVDETKKLNYTNKSINGKLNTFNAESNIISIEGDTVTANGLGSTVITYEDKKINVVVTDIITQPTLTKNKEMLPCNKYTEEEGTLIDNILEYKVNEAGYKTRAGAVAAARFLLLEFPYKIHYFFENGRVNNTGVNFADGEGRYYHKGLYLTNSKKDSIIASVSGPCIWGCPLSNWEDEPQYGFYWGVKMPNGLDCSGFVSWALYNGGFDPGDNGAGNSITDDELTDLGEFKPLTDELINSDVIKAGDLFNYWGHISIIVGIDDENYYVAESLQDFGGVVVNTYKKEKVNNTFSYVVLMDSFYESDGNYTKYW